jgi:hypothetical protein
METLQVGIGASTDPDAAAAGGAAAGRAVAALDGHPPALVIVYASTRYDLTALLTGVRAVTGDAPLVGASSSGQFHDGGTTVNDLGPGVSVLVMTAGQYRFGVASQTGMANDSFAVGYAVARAARDAAGPDLPKHAARSWCSPGSPATAGHARRHLPGSGAAVPWSAARPATTARSPTPWSSTTTGCSPTRRWRSGSPRCAR